MAGRWLLATLTVLALAACSPDRDEDSLFAPDLIDVPVVDALLVVGRPLPEIRLSRTQPPNAPYEFADAAIVGAEVLVHTTGSDTVWFAERGEAGVYWPGTELVVEPSATYHLVVTTAEGERVAAVTTTPAQLLVESWRLLSSDGLTVVRELRRFEDDGDAVFDAPENQLVYTQGVLEARLVGANPLGYQLGVANLELDSDFVIDLPFLDDEDLAEIPRQGSSPVVLVEDGAIRLPWFSIYFEGRHVWDILSLDQNAYDLVRTSPEEGAGFSPGGNVGDDFARPLFRVDGGIGLFGSASVDSLGFTILPQP